ncbi:MAG: hypothetical protein E5V21_09930 [Mesorhizobium sp.]|nr:MAG: hypothetical protein E5V21_09930 [Mesorhizobium sp.]
MSLAEGSAANSPEWWDKNSYGYTAHLTRRDWAWEFLLLLGDGCQHLLSRRADRHLLVVYGANVLLPFRLHIDAIWPTAQLKHRLWALEGLNSHTPHGRLP